MSDEVVSDPREEVPNEFCNSSHLANTGVVAQCWVNAGPGFEALAHH